jgi:hypothetical protein
MVLMCVMVCGSGISGEVWLRTSRLLWNSGPYEEDLLIMRLSCNFFIDIAGTVYI